MYYHFIYWKQAAEFLEAHPAAKLVAWPYRLKDRNYIAFTPLTLPPR